MDANLIIGNLCTLGAMGANAVSSTRKTTKGVLWMQNLSQVIYCASAVVLKGYSAAVQNCVSILRNFAAIYGIQSKVLQYLLALAGLVLGILFNNRGVIGLLPVLGNLQYTLAIFKFADRERPLKISFLISVASFVVFNVFILNFVGAACDLAVIITTTIVLIKGRKNS